MSYQVFKDSLSYYSLDYVRPGVKAEHQEPLAIFVSEIRDTIDMFDAGVSFLESHGYENPNAIMPLISRSDKPLPAEMPF